MSEVTRPILRWHGGKWMLAPWIISHFPEHRIYTEVYGGAASVLMRKPRAYAEIYNDLEGEVVNLFRVVQSPENADKLRELLDLTPFAREEYVLAYETSLEPVEQARRTVIRCFMGHGSNAQNPKVKTGFRSNSNRSGTTPAHDWVNWPSCMWAMTERLRGVIVENREALKILKAHDSAQTLHYVDPPYVLSSRTDDSPDYTKEMTDDNHKELAEVLNNLKGFVILSGYENDLYSEIYNGWKKVSKKTFADGANERIETLWFNKRAWEHQPAQRFDGI